MISEHRRAWRHDVCEALPGLGGRQRGNLIWLAGYRKRTGGGAVGASVGLTSATPAFDGTMAEVSVAFGGTTTPARVPGQSHVVKPEHGRAVPGSVCKGAPQLMNTPPPRLHLASRAVLRDHVLRGPGARAGDQVVIPQGYAG